MRSQGKHFSEKALNRIIFLLRDTDLTLTEIAETMQCSRSAVAAINRKVRIRLYSGRRSNWTVNDDRPAGAAVLDSALPR